MTAYLQVVCPHCDTVNRVPTEKLGSGGKCGKCHRPLFEGKPVGLSRPRFETHIGRSDIPVLVDFWAAWCGPCQMMAPAFEQAAQALEPRVRLVKVDTESEQALAATYGIRSIPTLMLFKSGQEAARIAGAMDAGGLVQWARQHL